MLQSRATLDKELADLNADIIRLGSMADTAVERAMEALYSRDAELAARVEQEDGLINDLRFKIEEKCLLVLATQQPVAGDRAGGHSHVPCSALTLRAHANTIFSGIGPDRQRGSGPGTAEAAARKAARAVQDAGAQGQVEEGADLHQNRQKEENPRNALSPCPRFRFA